MLVLIYKNNLDHLLSFYFEYLNYKNMLITVFTPTYNRAYILPKLYKSLKKQTCMDFEWLVVDDGSTDNTSELFEKWKDERSFSIRYIKQSNGGKHRAINHGVKVAKGELFFIVDSDDTLSTEAIQRIVNQYMPIRNDMSFGGVCGLRAYHNGERIGGERNFGILDCTSLDFRYKYRIKGDMAEVIRTHVLKEFPFPEVEGEKFCPEALIFNRIATKYKLRYFYEKVYLCEYLEDGLTASIVKVRMKSPQTSTQYYSELFYMPIPFIQKIKAAINYWRFAYCLDNTKPRNPIGWGCVCKPFGYLYHRKDIKL